MQNKRQQTVAAVVAALTAAGYVPHGHTRTTVQPTAGTTFAGGVPHGGRVVPGRQRFVLPGSRRFATVGPQTVCLYRYERGMMTEFQTVRAGDVAALSAALEAAQHAAK